MPDDLSLDFVALSDDDNIDQITIPGANGDTCEVCGLSLHYSGRGRHPRFCDEHKPRKSATGGRKTKGRKGSNAGLESAGTLLWGGLGYGLQLTARVPQQEAAGRVMQIQAPDAGVRLARILDPYVTKWRWLQALSGNAGPMSDMAALLLPPLVLGGLAGSPGAVEAARPILSALLAPVAAGIIEAQEKQQVMMDKMTGSGDKGAEAQAAVGDILDMVFANLGGSNEAQVG